MKWKLRMLLRRVVMWCIEGDIDALRDTDDKLDDRIVSLKTGLFLDIMRLDKLISDVRAESSIAMRRSAAAEGSNSSTSAYVAALWADFKARNPEDAKKAMDVVTGGAIVVDRGRGFEIEKAPVGSAEYDAKKGLADALAKAREIRAEAIGERLALQKGSEE